VNLEQKYAKLQAIVNDCFLKVGQILWGHGYLVTAYEEAVRFETDDYDDVDATEVDFVDLSDKVDPDSVQQSDIDWN